MTMTFYIPVLNLAIACYVIPDVIRYCIVCKQTWLFVNMLFSKKDKILIKNIYQMKGYNARQLRKEFPYKGWTNSSINRFLKKFRDTGTCICDTRAVVDSFIGVL